MEKSFAKSLVETIGFSVEKSIDQLTTICLCQRYLGISKLPLQFVNDRRQGMASVALCGDQGSRSVGTDQEDAALRQTLTEIEEKACRPRIDPLQIIEEEQQRMAPGQGQKGTGGLLEQGRPRQRRRTSPVLPHLAAQQLLQAAAKARILGPEPLQAKQQIAARKKAINQTRPLLHEGLSDDGQSLPQTVRMVMGESAARALRLNVTTQQLDRLAKRLIGVTDPGMGAAGPHRHDKILVGLHGAVRERLDKRCLPAARLSRDERDASLPVESALEEPIQPSQLATTTDTEPGESMVNGLERAARLTGGLQLCAFPLLSPWHSNSDSTVADAFVEVLGSRGRLDAQLVAQRTEARTILSQRGVTAPIQREEIHQASMCALIPGLHLQVAADVPPSLSVVLSVFLVLGQEAKHSPYLPIDLLPLQEQPLLEGRAVVQGKPAEKRSAVERQSGRQIVETGTTARRICYRSQAGARWESLNQVLKDLEVEGVVAGGVELEGAPSDAQKRRVGLPVTDHVTQVVKRVAKVAERITGRAMRPQKPGKHVPLMCLISLDSQVGQQGSHLTGLEAGKSSCFQSSLEMTK
jgi:hypothetical protein